MRSSPRSAARQAVAAAVAAAARAEVEGAAAAPGSIAVRVIDAPGLRTPSRVRAQSTIIPSSRSTLTAHDATITISDAGNQYGILTSSMPPSRKITVEVPEDLLEKAQRET